MESKYSAVIFDVDGTLLDSNDAHARAFEQAFKENGRIFPYEDIRRLIGMGGDNLLPSLCDLDPLSPEGEHISERKKEFFQREIDKLMPQPGAKELVLSLKERGFKIAIASSSAATELEKLLRLIGIDESLLDACTTSDDIDSSKPDPDAVHATLQKLKVDPSEAVMIGDTPFDLESATKAGVGTIAFLCGGFWSAKDFPGVLAIYKSPEEFLKHISESPLAAPPLFSRSTSA